MDCVRARGFSNGVAPCLCKTRVYNDLADNFRRAALDALPASPQHTEHYGCTAKWNSAGCINLLHNWMLPIMKACILVTVWNFKRTDFGGIVFAVAVFVA